MSSNFLNVRNTKLDFYKVHFKCQHDGETVLKAGEMAFFPGGPHDASMRLLDDKTITDRFPSNFLLEQIGIKSTMTAPEVVTLVRKCLEKTMVPSDHPEGQEELSVLLQSVLQFCEEEVNDQ